MWLILIINKLLFSCREQASHVQRMWYAIQETKCPGDTPQNPLGGTTLRVRTL